MLSVSAIKEKIVPLAEEYELINKVYLFGSYAKGVAHEDSDVDLLIENDESISLDVPAFIMDVKEALDLPVDVLTKRSLSKEFNDSIENSLVLIYEQ